MPSTHRPIGMNRPHGHGSRAVSFKWSAPTSNARREPPHDPAACRLAALVVVERFTPLKEKTCTCRANHGASSQEKRKTLFLGQKRCFSSMRPASSRPLRQGGVERIAPGAGAIRPRGWGKSLHPPRGVFSRENESARGFTLDAASFGGSPHALRRWAWTTAARGLHASPR